MSSKTIHELSPKQLAQILTVGVDMDEAQAASEPPARDQAQAMQQILAQELPLDARAHNALPDVLGRPSEEELEHACRTAGDALISSESSLVALKALQEYGKQLASKQSNEPESVAGRAVYYAAIGNALVYHGAKISSLTYDSLVKGFANLEGQDWVPPELRQLFATAGLLCRKLQRHQ